MSTEDLTGQCHDDILSFLQGVALANQPDDGHSAPLMVPVAFAARVSDKDNQDPTLSIPRQLAKCREALPLYCVIVAFFWDVESVEPTSTCVAEATRMNNLMSRFPATGESST
jgi:hypothetical protein